MVNPRGQLRACCHSWKSLRENGRVLSIPAGDHIDQVWRGPAFRELRGALAKGECHSHCQTCYNSEASGLVSPRQVANREWLSGDIGLRLTSEILDLEQPAMGVGQAPRSLDFRPGNKCNLMCRMCDPHSSHRVRDEQAQLIESNPEFASVAVAHFDSVQPIDDWYDRPEFLRELNSLTPNLRKVYLTGGEPTLIEANWRLMEGLVSEGRASSVHLTMNTNCTAVSDRLITTLSSFAQVTLNLSIDGVGRVNDYCRYPSKWPLVAKNFATLMRELPPHVRIWVTPVLHVYNLVYFIELLEWLDQQAQQFPRSLGVMVSPVRSPPFLNYLLTPRHVRLQVVDAWNRFLAGSSWAKEQMELRGFLAGAVAELASDARLAPQLWEELRIFTEALDKARGQSLADWLPEVAQFLQRPPEQSL